MKKEKKTFWGIIEDSKGHYNVLPVNTYCNITSFHNDQQRDIPVTCWRSEYPSIYFDLLVGKNIFKSEDEADEAFYRNWELK